MAITTDEILGKKPLAPVAKVPVKPVDNSLKGAPATMPGSGAGNPTDTKVTGKPVTTAVVPPPVSSDIKGAPAQQQPTPTKVQVAPTIAVAPAAPNASSVTEHGRTVQPVKETAGNGQEQSDAPKPKKTYEEMFRELYPEKTPEQLEKERKKRKRQAIFAAIGDGISALSNLYFTTQYAPNAYDPTKGMSAVTRERFARLKKEHDDNEHARKAGLLQAMRWDADDAKDQRNWNHTIEREKITDQWRRAAEGRKANLDHLRELLLGHQIDGAEYDAIEKKVKADNAPEYYQNRNKLIGEKAKTEKTKQNAHNASAYASKKRGDLAAAKAGKESEHDYKLTNADGQQVQFDENDFDNYYDAVPKEIKEKHLTYTYVGGLKKQKVPKPPTKEQKKAAIAEYVNSVHAPQKPAQSGESNKWEHASNIKY